MNDLLTPPKSSRVRAELRRNAPTIEAVIAEVAAFWNLSIDELVGPSRAEHVTYPRQVAMWILYRACGVQSERVAEALGRSDHTTAIHGTRAIDRLLREPDAADEFRSTRLDDQLLHLSRAMNFPKLADAVRGRIGSTRRVSGGGA